MTVTTVKGLVSSLAKWRDSIASTADGIDPMRRSLADTRQTLDTLPAVQDAELQGNIASLRQKGSIVTGQLDELSRDTATWRRDFEALDAMARSAPSVVTVLKPDAGDLFLRSMAAQKILSDLAAKVNELIKSAQSLKARVTVFNNNLKAFQSEAVSAGKAARGTGILRSVERIANLPGSVAGKAVEAITSPIKTPLTIALVGVALFGLIYLMTIMNPKGTAAATQALGGKVIE